MQHISTLEIEQEKKTQAMLTSELADLTGILREATIQMSTSVVDQNMVRYYVQPDCGSFIDELRSCDNSELI